MRKTVAHEIAHLKTSRLCGLVAELQGAVAPDVWEWFWHRFGEQEEELVRDLERLFCELLPEPVKVSPDARQD